jgi:hypothetical protein
MMQFIQAFPAAGPLIGDLVAEAQDWPKAQEIGKRLETVLPPPIKEQLEKDRESSNPQAGPTPEQMMQAQQQQQMQEAQAMQMQAGMAEMKAKVDKAVADADKAKAEAKKAGAEAEEAEIKLQMARATLAATHVENINGMIDRQYPVHTPPRETVTQ